MKLTKRKAIEKSIELWEWCAESGKEKEYWIGWERNGGKYKDMLFDCFLCELFNNLKCSACPYYIRYGRCTRSMLGLDSASPKLLFERWYGARTQSAKKKYAKQFLKQLKALLDDKATVTFEEVK